MRKGQSFPIEIFLVLIFLVHNSLIADEGKNDLRIVSRAKQLSAKINIKAEDEMVNIDFSNADRKRNKFGIGERVGLTLEGKNIGNPDKIAWSIKQEDSDKGSVVPTDSVIKTSLTISRTLKENSNIEIQAKTEFCDTAKISLQIVIPTKLSGKHARASDTRGENRRGVPLDGFPKDGDTIMSGTSAILELTAHPIDVNFEGVEVIELDAGTFPPNVNAPHKPYPKPLPLTNANRIFDSISSKDTVINVRALLKSIQQGSVNNTLPFSFYYNCTWQTSTGIIVAKNVHQVFSYDLISSKDPQKPEDVDTSVSKFGCTTQRSTCPNNKHSFTGGQSNE